jgi:3-hydroxyisobutyrate dehydrogenase-like beta-hydroxyacid dehydrogenase
MANLGFVGLGAMGSRITKRLLSKGHTVTGYDLFPAKRRSWSPWAGKWASSPRAVCEAADTTFVMVTNTAALDGASQGPDGLLAGPQHRQADHRHEHGRPCHQPHAGGEGAGRRAPT